MGKRFLDDTPEESAEELYENAPCGYISFSPDGTIFRINNTLLHLLNYEKKEDVVNVKKIQDLFRIGGKIYFETHFFPLVKMQGFVKEINFDLLKKDGSYFPALLNVNQISPAEGSSMIYRASILDITDRKKYEQALLQGKEKAEEATRAKAEFLSTISHEIRTPLNAIVGIGNLIQNTSLDDLQREYARILQLSSASLLELVNNLLDLSKLEAEKVKLEKRNFSLKQLLEVLLHSFHHRAQEKKIDLKKDFPKDLPDHLMGDPVKLNQILTNLLGNAIKFTKEGYVQLKIKVVEKSAKYVVLQFTVCDTGIGIPKDKLEIIFQEFSQASYDVNLEYGGTGLGLTISQKLLQMHGSELHVASEEGKGSEFSFAVKYKFSLKTTPKRNKRSRLIEILAASRAKVLVVDDNANNLFITSQYLRGWGLNAEIANSGEEAIKSVQKNSFDIILMDLHMPNMNGYEASLAIRELNHVSPPVIIALSASGRGDINVKMKKAGISAYVSKPFDPIELQETMVHFLNGKIGDPNKYVEDNAGIEANWEVDKDSNPNAEQLANKETESTKFLKYLQLANGNPLVLDKLIKNSLQSLKKLRKEFSTAVFNEKGEKLGRLIHKNTMTLHYLEAHTLNQMLEDFHQSLEQEKEEKEPEVLKRSILEELDRIISEVETLDMKELL